MSLLPRGRFLKEILPCIFCAGYRAATAKPASSCDLICLDNAATLLVIRPAKKREADEFTPLSGVALLLGTIYYGECELNVLVEPTIEEIRRRYASTASEMHCPYHHKNARVEIAGETQDDLNVEVFACCEEFAERVQDALRDVL